MNHSQSKAPVRWTEDRVERLLLKVFGDPPGSPPAKTLPRRRTPWSHWALIATCASLLLVVAPALMVSRNSQDLVDRGDAAATDSESEDMVVAEASSSDEELSDESSGDELSGEEASDSEASEDATDATST